MTVTVAMSMRPCGYAGWAWLWPWPWPWQWQENSFENIDTYSLPRHMKHITFEPTVEPATRNSFAWFWTFFKKVWKWALDKNKDQMSWSVVKMYKRTAHALVKMIAERFPVSGFGVQLKSKLLYHVRLCELNQQSYDHREFCCWRRRSRGWLSSSRAYVPTCPHLCVCVCACVCVCVCNGRWW